MGDEHVDENRLQAEFPYIHEMIYTLRIQYVLENQSECNLTLVCEF